MKAMWANGLARRLSSRNHSMKSSRSNSIKQFRSDVGNKEAQESDPGGILSRPRYYYCQRDFDDQQVLQAYEREIHSHSDRCSRRLNAAGGLTVYTANAKVTHHPSHATATQARANSKFL
jgi:hypothetical protein